MGDLAVAIVDLARTAQQRRDARRSLRESVGTLVTELLKHLRVGDWIELPRPNGSHANPVHYAVERVTWPIEPLMGQMGRLHVCAGSDGEEETTTVHPKGATTLVRYDLNFQNPETSQADGAVLLDVRTPGRHVDGGEAAVVGRTIMPMGPRFMIDDVPQSNKLRFATDDELLCFAEEAELVIKGFSQHCRNTAAKMADLADTITKLTPR